jgi:hypothetical protein
VEKGKMVDLAAMRAAARGKGDRPEQSEQTETVP